MCREESAWPGQCVLGCGGPEREDRGDIGVRGETQDRQQFLERGMESVFYVISTQLSTVSLYQN